MEKSDIMRKLMTIATKVDMAHYHLDMEHSSYSPLKAYTYTHTAHMMLIDVISKLFEEGVRPSDE